MIGQHDATAQFLFGGYNEPSEAATLSWQLQVPFLDNAVRSVRANTAGLRPVLPFGVAST
jgi:hypothetical protein